jgi:bifunctional oligoribonuclease and PAP phosphatase NrnA
LNSTENNSAVVGHYFQETSFELLKSKLNNASKITLLSHTSPDGDSIGSSLGFAGILKAMGKDVTVVIPDPAPQFLAWMPTFDSLFVALDKEEEFANILDETDLLFCLDFNEPFRIGKQLGPILCEHSCEKIMIDHHLDPSDFCQLTFSYIEASSVCELIIALAFELGVDDLISNDVAQCLYTGLVTDSGSFRFSNVRALTHYFAAILIQKGLEHAKVHQNLFDNNSLSRIQLQGYAISQKLEVINDLGVALVYLVEEELDRFNFEKGDTDGIVNMALSLKGIRIAVFLNEKEGRTKMSFRSIGKENPINLLAAENFEGGGHANASGGIFIGTALEAIAVLKSVLPKYVS